jgi:hypothetical protein
MAVPTGIDRSAPVIALDEIDIDAPLDAVWQLHVDRQRVADLADRHHRRACVVDSPSGHSPSSVLPSQCGQGTPHGHTCANTSLYTSAGFRGTTTMTAFAFSRRCRCWVEAPSLQLGHRYFSGVGGARVPMVHPGVARTDCF